MADTHIFFSLGLYELFYQWAIRKKEFLLLSKSKILQKSIGSAVQIGLGMASFGSLGLIIGSIFPKLADSLCLPGVLRKTSVAIIDL